MYFALFFILSAVMAGAILLVRNRLFIRMVMILFAGMLCTFTLYGVLHFGGKDSYYFTFDSIGLILLVVLSLLTITTIWHGFIFVARDGNRKYRVYHASIIGLVVSMTGAYLADNITVNWIFVEATTLTVAALIYHERTPAALEATWKYVFICSTGIAIAYMGILFLNASLAGDSHNDLSYAGLMQSMQHVDPVYLKLAFVFILVGFSTKMGLFPMHTVTIDAHTVAPPPVSAFISTTLMNVGFLSIFRVYSLVSQTEIFPFIQHVLIIAGLFSLLISSGYIYKAVHNKRLLAYSSMENMGIVAICLGIGGIGYYAAILHIILHSLTKAAMFYQVGIMHRVLHTYDLKSSGKYFSKFPLGGLTVITGLICITAVPPSGMFISEFTMFKAMVMNGEWWLFILTALFLCFVLYAFATRFMHILFSDRLTEPETSNTNHPPVRKIEVFSQLLLFAIVITICFYQPDWLQNMIEKAIQYLPGQ